MVLIYDDQKTPMMFDDYLDKGNIFVATFMLVCGCVLAVISWVLTTSGIFAALYILLGAIGFVCIYLLKLDDGEYKYESLRKKYFPGTFRSTWRKDTENSAMNCKLIAATLLNEAQVTDEKNSNQSSSMSNDLKADLLHEDHANIVSSFQPADTKKIESATSISDENISSPTSDETLGLIPLESLQDMKNKEENCESVYTSNTRSNGVSSVVQEIVLNDKPLDYLNELSNVHDAKTSLFSNGKSYSTGNDIPPADHICIVTPPAMIEDYPQKISTSKNATDKKTERKFLNLERKNSVEPSCFSCLCVNMPSQTMSNDKRPILTMKDEPYDERSYRLYNRTSYAMERSLHNILGTTLQNAKSSRLSNGKYTMIKDSSKLPDIRTMYNLKDATKSPSSVI